MSRKTLALMALAMAVPAAAQPDKSDKPATTPTTPSRAAQPDKPRATDTVLDAPPSDRPAVPAEVEALRARIGDLEAQLEEARAAGDRRLAELREDFDASWKRREEAFAARLATAEAAAPRPRRAVADSRLRVGDAKLRPGDPIPEGTDLAKLPHGTWRYEGA